MTKTTVAMILFLTVPAALAQTLLIRAHGRPVTQDVRLDVLYRYRLDNGPLSDCQRTGEPELLCSVPVTPGAHDLEVVITVSGYKTFSRLLSRLRVGHENVTVDLGDLKLILSELKVVQVLRKEASTGGAEFEINLHQERIKDINITEILILGELDEFGNCGALTTPVATFKISDQFVLTSRAAKVAGKAFEENNTNYQLPVDGQIVARQCPNRMRYLRLTLKTAIGIRAKDAVLVLRLPPEFKIVDGVQKNVPLPGYIRSPNEPVSDTDVFVADPKEWGQLSLASFKKFIFQLTTTGAEDASVIAHYP